MTHRRRIVRSTPDQTTRARQLRRAMTVPERLLWSRLRNRRLNGLRFTRQKVLGPFIADFYCAAARLIVEVDGMSHDGTGGFDQQRTAAIQKMGLRVIRVANDHVLQDLDAVLSYINQQACRTFPDEPGD